jgi:two-component system, LytTR family, sensor kinase
MRWRSPWKTASDVVQCQSMGNSFFASPLPNVGAPSTSNDSEPCMPLEVKLQCERCGTALEASAEAKICSYGCTFCPDCASGLRDVCPNCGGELVRRPRRIGAFEATPNESPTQHLTLRSWPVWGVSFGVWTVVALIDAASTYHMGKWSGSPISVGHALGENLTVDLTYAPLTPVVLALALRFPLRKENWLRRSLLHLGFGLIFAALHVVLILISPWGHWNENAGRFTSAIWDSSTHSFHLALRFARRILLAFFPGDAILPYVPIVAIAHAVSYYEWMTDNAIRSAKLEMELAKSQLHALKSHLQPHFLFNTLHSISALMFTDVSAADKMMTRLSDLLRMNLESVGSQLTTLNRDLEFVAGYLEIEKIRFEERLNIIVDVQPEVLDAQVPSLMLQPIVENAVRHGISHVSQGGTIWINARLDGRHLDIRVKDNGLGIRNSVGNLPRAGLGLRTTRERLIALYGNDQSLDVDNVPGGGVEARIRIPFRPDSNTEVETAIVNRMEKHEARLA